MIYLQPSEYEQYGLEATTPASWVTAASAMVDAHCRRATLGVVKYSERVRVNDGRNSVRLTYLPLAISDSASSPIVSMRGRYAMPRRGGSDTKRREGSLCPNREKCASNACTQRTSGQSGSDAPRIFRRYLDRSECASAACSVCCTEGGMT
jgi:hypothetical protein